MHTPVLSVGRGFRDDINGLRALAVALVMLYHFDVPGVRGGFVGVDVFFVVSGYLMTSIILSQHETGTFSFLRFYRARARRIVPALAALCATLLAFGWFWLDATDYRALSAEAASALLFFSNMKFANEVGYFDLDAHQKWLLHTWSLSVEWQFYLLYPVLLYGIVRLARRWLGPLLALLTVASLAHYVGLGGQSSTDAFYLLPPRAWELVAGGLVFVYEPRIRSWRLPGAPLAYAGAALIVLGAMGQRWLVWPTPLILPVAGAVLVLMAAHQGSLLTANPVSRAIGQWSYSIYLWHWPLVVAALYFGLEKGPALSVGLVGASILLGALSCRFVEEPFRHGVLRDRAGLPALAGLAAVVALPAGLLVLADGLPGRHPEALKRIEQQALTSVGDEARGLGQARCGWNKKTEELVPCDLGDTTAPPSVAVWGDSHASKYRLSVDAALAAAKAGGELYYRNGCRPLQGLMADKGSTLKDCTVFNEKVLDRLASSRNIGSVIVIANWSYDIGAGKQKIVGFKTHFGDGVLPTVEERHAEYGARMVKDLCALTRLKKHVAVTAPVPYFGVDVPRTMSRTFLFTGKVEVPTLSRATHVARNKVALEALAEANRQCGVEILDPLPFFCDEATCFAAVDGKPIFSDDNHLSEHGNALVRPLFEGFLARATASR